MSVPQEKPPIPHARHSGKNKPPAGTRQAILDAAQEFLWTRPFREMTIRSLMAETDVSRPAFYQYFSDVHVLMETLLDDLRDEILGVVEPWVLGTGDPVSLLRQSLDGLVRVCYRRGPILRAASDAATSDNRMETAWTSFLHDFDDVVTERITADQAQKLIPPLDARPMAIALNRLDAYTLIDAFGTRPRRRPEPILDAITRIWVSTLYGPQHLAKEKPPLERQPVKNQANR